MLTAGSAWIRAHRDVIDDAPAAIAETAESEGCPFPTVQNRALAPRQTLDMLGIWPKSSSHPRSGAVEATPAKLVLFVALLSRPIMKSVLRAMNWRSRAASSLGDSSLVAKSPHYTSLSRT